MTARAPNPYRTIPEPYTAILGDLDREWTLNAACRGYHDPDVFHPPMARASEGMTQSASELRRKLKIAEAKNICARCPVTDQCLAYGDAIGDYKAIWGGRTPRERGRKREA